MLANIGQGAMRYDELPKYKYATYYLPIANLARDFVAGKRGILPPAGSVLPPVSLLRAPTSFAGWVASGGTLRLALNLPACVSKWVSECASVCE